MGETVGVERRHKANVFLHGIVVLLQNLPVATEQIGVPRHDDASVCPSACRIIGPLVERRNVRELAIRFLTVPHVVHPLSIERTHVGIVAGSA